MPPIRAQTVPVVSGRSTPRELLDAGVARLERFYSRNPVLPVQPLNVVPGETWYFDACAYWRPVQENPSPGELKLIERGYGPGINLCLEECARPATQNQVRNWSWPGSVTDRTPYGVVAHELGHAADWHMSRSLGLPVSSYGGEYSRHVRVKAKEPPLTSYCPNDWEWFAECFRLFVTNPLLLRALRPRTYAALCERWQPLIPLGALFPKEGPKWRHDLGEDCPLRIVANLERRVREGR